MFTKLKYLLTAMCLFTAFACSKPIDDGQKSITVDKTELSTEYTATTLTIAVKANTAWTITGAAEWCVVSPASGDGNATVTLTIAANNNPGGRSCTLKIEGDVDDCPEVNVAQKGTETSDDALTISSSKDYIASDGVDSAEFTVTLAGSDVTADADIYMYYNSKSTKMTGNSFTATKNDTYKFYAIYDGNISPKISVGAVTKLLSVPDDSQPDNYSFTRRVLGVQGTSVGCVYCPRLIQVITDFNSTPDADKVVFASAHTNINIIDPMTSEGSLYILDYLGMNSYPSFKIDFTTDLSNTASIKTINSAADRRIAVPAKCGLSAAVANVDGQIVVDVEVKTSTEGTYNIGVWLLEDGIYSEQYDSTGFHTDEMDTHYNAVRAIYPYDMPEGQMLGDGKIAANSKTSYHCEFTASKSYVDKVDKCHVVIFTVGSDRTIDNVINCPVGESVSYQYK